MLLSNLHLNTEKKNEGFCFGGEEEERKGREVKERNCGIWFKFLFFFKYETLFSYNFLMDFCTCLGTWEWICLFGEKNASHPGIKCVIEWWNGGSKKNCELFKWDEVSSWYSGFSTQLLLARFPFPPLSDSSAVPLNLSCLSTKFPWWLFSLLSLVHATANQYCKWNFIFRNYWTSMYESA